MGLLDAFNTDEGRLGLGLLAAAGPSMQPMGLGQRLAQGMGYVDQQKEAAMKRKFLESQIAENESQNEARKAQIAKAAQLQDMVKAFMGGGASEISPGAFTPSLGGMGPTMPPSMQTQPGLAGKTIDQIAALKVAGGPDLLDAFKWVKDPLQLQQGNTYVDRATGASNYMPKVGEGMARGADGFYGDLPGYAEGVARIEGAKAGATEKVKAGFDPVTVTPRGEPPQIVTRAKLVSNPSVSGTRIGAAEQRALDSDRGGILGAELVKAQKDYQNAVLRGDQSAAARAQGDIAALTRELGGKSATVGMPLQSKEEELRGTKGVEGDANENVARAKDVKTAQKFLSVTDQVEKILKANPTSSGAGAVWDQVGGFFGKSPAGAVEAQQLKALGGWLVANVPRMEGPQSNFDVGNYQTMAADVANDRLPLDRRMAALGSIKEMMKATVDGGGVMKPEGSWEPTAKKSAVSSGGWSATLKK